MREIQCPISQWACMCVCVGARWVTYTFLGQSNYAMFTRPWLQTIVNYRQRTPQSDTTHNALCTLTPTLGPDTVAHEH